MAELIRCRAVYPVMQTYCVAGEFTVGDRIRAAIKENLIFYGICLGVVLIIFLWIVANRPPGEYVYTNCV
jgi:hypothetical protein